MGLKSNSEIVIELKRAIERKGITQSELKDMLEEHGTPIARTTLQRFFREGSETNDSFRYKYTLKPMSELLLDAVPEEDPLAELEEKVAHLSDQIDELIEIATSGIAFMNKQIDLKDTRMERKDSWIQEQRDEILELREENKRLEEDIHKLLEKCANCDRTKHGEQKA